MVSDHFHLLDGILCDPKADGHDGGTAAPASKFVVNEKNGGTTIHAISRNHYRLSVRVPDGASTPEVFCTALKRFPANNPNQRQDDHESSRIHGGTGSDCGLGGGCGISTCGGCGQGCHNVQVGAGAICGELGSYKFFKSSHQPKSGHNHKSCLWHNNAAKDQRFLTSHGLHELWY
jgi:hypothetical protein